MSTGLHTASDLVKAANRHDPAEGPVLYARNAGDSNLQNSPALRADLLKLAEEQGPQGFVLNLSEVPYMDSSAIAVLVE